MPFVRQYEIDGAIVAVWEITETAEELSAMVAEPYAVGWREAFASEARRKEWLAVRALLKVLLGNEARVEYDRSGRPLLAFDEHAGCSSQTLTVHDAGCSMFVNDACARNFLHVSKDICISISHTKSVAAIALCSNGEIGLDVETLSRNVLGASERFIAPEALMGVPPGDENEIALLHWCAKEALFKIVGNIGGNFKDNIFVAPFEMSHKGVLSLSVAGLPNYVDGEFVAHYFKDKGMLFVLCKHS